MNAEQIASALITDAMVDAACAALDQQTLCLGTSSQLVEAYRAGVRNALDAAMRAGLGTYGQMPAHERYLRAAADWHGALSPGDSGNG